MQVLSNCINFSSRLRSDLQVLELLTNWGIYLIFFLPCFAIPLCLVFVLFIARGHTHTISALDLQQGLLHEDEFEQSAVVN